MRTDFEERKRIINDVHTNLFVDASAGAGKTASLTQRMVRMVECGIPVNEICTITFTKNAANEFYQRFQKLLAERSKVGGKKDPYGLLPDVTEESARLCAKALEDIDLCFMGTIDSFTNMVINSHPVEAGIPVGLEMSSPDDVKEAIKKTYFRIVDGEFDKVYKDLSVLARKFIHCFSKPAEVFCNEMPYYLDRRFMEIEDVEINIPSKTSVDDLIIACDKVLSILNRPGNEEFISNTKKETLEKANNYRYIISRKIGEPYDYALIYKLAKCVKDLSTFNKSKAKVEACEELLVYYDLNSEKGSSYSLKDEYCLIIDEIDKYIYEVGIAFAKATLKIVSSELKKENVLTYTEYLITLRDMLRSDISKGGHLIKNISNKYKYYLLDESQDTNPVQTEIFFYLASVVPTLDWENADLREGALFIVGDPKQSIYRFRCADVDNYKRIEDIFEGKGQVAVLTRNFRSTNALCDWINSHMGPYFDGQLKFEDIELTGPRTGEEYATFNGVYRYKINGKTQEIDSPEVIKIIKGLVNNKDITIRPFGEDKPRMVEYGDIMVITLKKSFNVLIDMLDKENIPYNAEGICTFDTCVPFNELKRILYALISPKNEGYVISALKTNYISLSDDNFINIFNYSQKNEHIRYQIYRPFEYKINDEITCAFNTLNKLYEETKYLNYASKYSYLLENLNIFSSYHLHDVDLCYYALELLRKAEAEGVIYSDESAIKFIDSLNSSNNDYERCLRINKRSNAIKISNVHKVKGLQSPICILAVRGKQKDSFDVISNGAKSFINYKFENHQVVKKDRDEAEYYSVVGQAREEAKRIDYVAATRAEAALVIGDYENDKGEQKDSSWVGLVDTGNHYLQEIPEFKNTPVENKLALLDLEEMFNESHDESLLNNETVKDKTFTLTLPSKTKARKLSRDLEDISDSEFKTMNKDISATLIGTMVHRLMELLAKSKELDKDIIIDSIINEYGNYEVRKLLSKVYDDVTNGGYKQSNGVCSDILNTIRNSSSFMCEVPFSYMDKNSLIHGVMDLVYEVNGEYFIIDYKTNLECNSSKLDEEYKNQLELYRKALKDILRVDSVAHTYHIDV